MVLFFLGFLVACTLLFLSLMSTVWRQVDVSVTAKKDENS